MNDESLRKTFDQNAEIYNDTRPGYPEDLFESLIKITNLKDGASLLEIGPGTGQATKDLAKRGYKITAVELGESLAAIARRELQAYPKVEVLTGSFEDTELPASHYDLVFSATAFHWIKPEFKYTKPYKLLKNKAHIAIIHTHHVSDGREDQYYYKTQPIYRRYFEDRPKSHKDTATPLQTPADLKPDQLDESLFKPVYFGIFEQVITYKTEDYLQLISTYSPNLAMPADKREAFFAELRKVINEQMAGRVEKHYAHTLTIGEKALQ